VNLRSQVGHLPLELQGKLLRVLQEGEFIKLGTNRPQRTDVRFIAATNADLDKLMTKGMFRKDLYYRLRGGWLRLPPLNERTDDIPLLISRFLEEFGVQGGGVSTEDEAMSLFMEYNYPGNVRELKAIIQSAANLSQGRPISGNFLPEHIRKQRQRTKITPQPGTEPIVPLEEMEKDYILNTYNQLGKNKSQAAKVLGIGLNTIRRKLEQYGEA